VPLYSRAITGCTKNKNQQRFIAISASSVALTFILSAFATFPININTPLEYFIFSALAFTAIGLFFGAKRKQNG
jgi:hypothetical protein